jgi:2-keto-4-pentenoate hydratase/2-oxohepta-3-ene-1,7-dioic acid hydratase in catechol pathway
VEFNALLSEAADHHAGWPRTDEMLSVISEYITIEPGDMVMTGSSSGSAGIHGNSWLKPGDRIHAEIGGIGELNVCMHDD